MPITEDELILYHYGIKNQKWGVRRFQNKDGSLTPAGEKRYGTVANFNKVQRAEAKAKKDAEKARIKANVEGEISKIRQKYGLEETTKSKTKPKLDSELSNDELKAKLERARMMSELDKLTPKQVGKGEKFLNAVKDTAVPILKDSLKEPITKYLKNKFSEALGVDKETVESMSKKLAQQAQDAENRAKIATANERMRKYNEEAKQRAEAARAAEQQRIEAEVQRREAEQQRVKAEREREKRRRRLLRVVRNARRNP